MTICPKVLIVTRELRTAHSIREALAHKSCDLTTVFCAEVPEILTTSNVDLVVTDLPDPARTNILSTVRKKCPVAGVVVIAHPDVKEITTLFRSGATDVVFEPFTATHIKIRLAKALLRQTIVIRNARRLDNLKRALKERNRERAKGAESVIRIRSDFRNHVKTRDFEECLTHFSDWITRTMGFANVAVWLESDNDTMCLGLTAAYTFPFADHPDFTKILSANLIPLIIKKGSVCLSGAAVKNTLSPSEFSLLEGNEIIGCSCTHFGEVLAVILLFRSNSMPFGDNDLMKLDIISPVFARMMAEMCESKEKEKKELKDAQVLDDDSNAPDKKSDADWWKRGEPPPF